ncbi:hypothetical protein [Mesorhizobium sp.]|uniref:hypothetical protein n=1 Tax=Mesorhizobium sp. TaxID=1871066 RepID=UPI003BAD84BE
MDLRRGGHPGYRPEYASELKYPPAAGILQGLPGRRCCLEESGFGQPDPDKRRHMPRLWLSIPGDRPLPECFRQRDGSIEISDRGGIIVKGTRLNVPL